MTDVAEIAHGLTKAQRAILLAMRAGRPKKWRAIYRDAKVKHWVQLPFSLAIPTLTGLNYSPHAAGKSAHIWPRSRERALAD